MITLNGGIDVVVGSPHPIMREGLIAIIDRDPRLTVVGEAADTTRLAELVELKSPSVVVVAHEPPDFDAMAVSRGFPSESSDGRAAPGIVALTGDLGHRELLEMIQVGVRGVVLDTTVSTDLTSTLCTVAAGSIVLGVPSLATAIKKIIGDCPPGFADCVEDLDMLTKRELEVLIQVARGKSNLRIARDMCVSEATVKSHLYHMCRKLNLTDRTQAVIVAYEMGLVKAAAS